MAGLCPGTPREFRYSELRMVDNAGKELEEHKAMPVSRECYELRSVVVFKCNVKGANRERLDFYNNV